MSAPTPAAVRHGKNLNLGHEAMVVHNFSPLTDPSTMHQTASAGGIRTACVLHAIAGGASTEGWAPFHVIMGRLADNLKLRCPSPARANGLPVWTCLSYPRVHVRLLFRKARQPVAPLACPPAVLMLGSDLGKTLKKK